MNADEKLAKVTEWVKDELARRGGPGYQTDADYYRNEGAVYVLEELDLILEVQ